MALVTNIARHLATILALAPALLAQNTGSIEGRILNSATGAGIGGVGIRLLDSQRTVLTATTDDSGSFRIGALHDGQYSIEYQKEGFLVVRPVPPPRISGAEPLRFTAEMATWPTLRGRVTGPDGKPAARIHVQLNVGLDVATDADGFFTFTKIAPGAYTLVARPDPPRAERSASPDADRIETMPTYYPSVIDSAQAEPIQIRGGADLAGYEIRLRTAPVQRIRGTVLGLDGKPAAKAQVSLVTPPSGPPFLMRGAVNLQVVSAASLLAEQQTQTAADGSFEFIARRGDWLLRAASSIGLDPQHRDLYQTGGASASLGTRDLDGVTVRFAQSFTLDLSIDWGQSKPASPRPQQLIFLPLEGQGTGIAMAGQMPTVSMSPGRAIVMAGLSPTPGMYPAAVIIGGRDVLGQEVNLLGPQPVQLVYRSDGGSVSGTIDKGANLIVALIPQESSPLKIAISGRTDAGGAFSIADIPPGDYYAVAIQDTQGMQTPVFRSFVAANGTRVKVEPSSSTTLELRASRWP
jgi:Carboxypeptidase regulatory-like domain